MELELLRTIAHGAMGMVTADGEKGACVDQEVTRQNLAALLNDWIERFEAPRLIAKSSLGSTEVVEVRKQADPAIVKRVLRRADELAACAHDYQPLGLLMRCTKCRRYAGKGS